MSTGLEVVGTGLQVFGALQSAKFQKEQQQAQLRMDDLKAARERTMQIRNARTASARIAQSAANQGAGMSSSAQAGAAGVTSEAYSNIQYIGFEQQTGQAIAKARQQELNAQGISAIGTGVSDIGAALAGNSKGLAGF